MHDQNSIDIEETSAQKYQRALDLFTESELKVNILDCSFLKLFIIESFLAKIIPEFQ